MITLALKMLWTAPLDINDLGANRISTHTLPIGVLLGAGASAAEMTTHLAALDPHEQYSLETDVTDALALKVNNSAIGAPSGVAPLDENSNVPEQYLSFVQTGTGAVATTVQAKLRELEVSPNDFPGNDKQKIEAAIAEAITTRKTVVFPRMYDITGLGSISITKPFLPRWFLRLIGTGGGIKKNDGGYVFTSATMDTMDFKVQGMRFESVPGAGAVLWNGNKIVRVYSNNNQYIGWDTIAEGNNSYLQQYELIDEHVSGGRGWLVSFRENWGCKFVRINIEDRNYSRGCAIDIASSTLTVSNHGMPNDFVVYITTTGSLPTGLTPAGATNAGKYYVVNATTDTFKLSATSGGAAITLSGRQSGTHRVYYGDGHGIGNSEDLNALANRNLIVSQCVFENNNGTFLRLCGSFTSSILDNYTEGVRGEHIDMQSFKTHQHCGLKIAGNMFGEKNPNKYPILWGKIAGSNTGGSGGAVSENNASDNNLHNLDASNLGYIFSAGDFSVATLLGGTGNARYFIRGGQYKYSTNADGSVMFENGTMRSLGSQKEITLTPGQTTAVTIPFAIGTLNPTDSVSITVTNGYPLQILATQVAFSGNSVVVWVKNLDAANSFTRTLYCKVLQLAI